MMKMLELLHSFKNKNKNAGIYGGILGFKIDVDLYYRNYRIDWHFSQER